MRKKIPVCLAAVLIVILSISLTAANKNDGETLKKKGARYTLCSQITKESLKDVRASKKRTENGVVIVMTSPRSDVVKKLKEIIAECKTKQSPGNATKTNKTEILRMEGVNINETNLNNGIRLELSSENPQVAEKIKKVRVPGSFKTRPKQNQEKK